MLLDAPTIQSIECASVSHLTTYTPASRYINIYIYTYDIFTNFKCMYTHAYHVCTSMYVHMVAGPNYCSQNRESTKGSVSQSEQNTTPRATAVCAQSPYMHICRFLLLKCVYKHTHRHVHTHTHTRLLFLYFNVSKKCTCSYGRFLGPSAAREPRILCGRPAICSSYMKLPTTSTAALMLLMIEILQDPHLEF